MGSGFAASCGGGGGGEAGGAAGSGGAACSGGGAGEAAGATAGMFDWAHIYCSGLGRGDGSPGRAKVSARLPVPFYCSSRLR